MLLYLLYFYLFFKFFIYFFREAGPFFAGGALAVSDKRYRLAIKKQIEIKPKEIIVNSPPLVTRTKKA